MVKEIICVTTRPLKLKKRLEASLGIKISSRLKNIIIEGSPEEEYIAEQVILALDLGFSLQEALSIKEEEFLFEILNIKEHTKSHNLERVRGRIIGEKGKTIATLSGLTGCYLKLNENQLGIIGPPEIMKITQEALTSLINGSKTANVYAFLEKKHPEEIGDLGLKKKE